MQRTKRALAMCICVLHAQCSCSTGLVFIYNIHMWTYKHTKTDHTMVDFTIRYCIAHREREIERGRESSRYITFILSHKIPKILWMSSLFQAKLFYSIHFNGCHLFILSNRIESSQVFYRYMANRECECSLRNLFVFLFPFL